MFLHYYVDKRPHHKHTVHHVGCVAMPVMEYRQYLGMFETCDKAVAMARVVYPPATACATCARIHVKPIARVRK